MIYQNIIPGTFIKRPNRFIAEVEIAGKIERVHVKNTGRCGELLIEGASVFVQDHAAESPLQRPGGGAAGAGATRKTRYSLIGVKKGELLINMDSQAPNQAVKEALVSGALRLSELSYTLIRPETKYGDSRLDFYLEDAGGQKAFAEVKGVTLEEDGVARFPDAPTERGIKHIQELCRAKSEGYGAFVIFVIQMKGVHRFEPNDRTHEAFGAALREAAVKGVQILAFDCLITEDSMVLDQPIPVNL